MGQLAPGGWLSGQILVIRLCSAGSDHVELENPNRHTREVHHTGPHRAEVVSVILGSRWSVKRIRTGNIVMVDSKDTMNGRYGR